MHIAVRCWPLTSKETVQDVLDAAVGEYDDAASQYSASELTSDIPYGSEWTDRHSMYEDDEHGTHLTLDTLDRLPVEALVERIRRGGGVGDRVAAARSLHSRIVHSRSAAAAEEATRAGAVQLLTELASAATGMLERAGERRRDDEQEEEEEEEEEDVSVARRAEVAGRAAYAALECLQASDHTTSSARLSSMKPTHLHARFHRLKLPV